MNIKDLAEVTNHVATAVAVIGGGGWVLYQYFIRPGRLVGAVALAILICWALLYFGEYFHVHWVREAGGGVVRASL